MTSSAIMKPKTTVKKSIVNAVMCAYIRSPGMIRSGNTSQPGARRARCSLCGFGA
jgi:formate dehydrogenase maturation protein FdhE